MKRSLILLSVLALAGCSSLNVSWQVTASYNTKLETKSLTQHGLEDTTPLPPPVVIVPMPAPLPPGKAS